MTGDVLDDQLSPRERSLWYCGIVQLTITQLTIFDPTGLTHSTQSHLLQIFLPEDAFKELRPGSIKTDPVK